MADDPQLEGVTLQGKYRVESLIGRGGMGTVWSAVHATTGRKLAIKVLSARLVEQHTVVERFGREARAASAVNHPGIVEVLDLDRMEDGTPFLVMERLEGETLADMLDRRERLRPNEVTTIATQLLEALDAAHGAGVVHRDLKPENIVISRRRGGRESVKILDFGISAKEDESVSELTLEGSVLGTPHYMAPEQALGEQKIDGRADLYALGVVLFECLTGDVPFDAPNYNRLMHVILHDPAPPLPDYAQTEPHLAQLVSALLQKDPALRPQSSKESLARLQGEDPPARAVAAGTEATEFDGLPMESPSARDSIFAIESDEPPPAFGAEASNGASGALEIDEEALARVTRPTQEPSLAMNPGRPPGTGDVTPRRIEREATSRAAAVKDDSPSDRSPQTPEGTAGRRVWILAAVLVVLLGAVGWWQIASPRGQDDAPDPAVTSERSPRRAPRAPLPRPAPEKNRNATVSVRIRNLPAGARLYLDGLPTGEPPLRMRQGEEPRELRIMAPGYVERTLKIRPTMDLRLSGRLQPL